MTRKEQIEKAAVENGCGFYDNGYARFAEGAAWADEHPHWISVEDELPNFGDAVLIYTKNGGCAVVKYEEGEWNISDILAAINVTHWMHLPQPTKKGGKQ